MAFAGWSQRAPLSGVEVERRIERLAGQQGKDLYSFVICLLADHRPIGEATLGDLDLHNGSALVGIVIGEPAAWGKGYGTDAVNALVDFAFGELRSGCGSTSGRRTRGRGAPTKRPASSTRGRLRHDRYEGGEYTSGHVMSILRGEWLGFAAPGLTDAYSGD